MISRSKTPSGLRFTAKGHSYRYRGRVVPSVTQVLEAMGLSTIHLIPDKHRVFALERGRLVHLACELYDQGRLKWATLDPQLAPYVRAWAKFSEVMDFVPYDIERRVVIGGGRCAGTLDVRGSAKHYPRLLIDRKCGGTEPPGTPLQTAAYQLGLGPDGVDHVRATVLLKPTGEPKFLPADPTTNARDQGWFLAILTTYEVQRLLLPKQHTDDGPVFRRTMEG